MMRRPTERPACWTKDATSRATYRASPWGEARACTQAADPDTWAIALHHTPTCAGCARAWLSIRAWSRDQFETWRRMQQEKLK